MICHAQNKSIKNLTINQWPTFAEEVNVNPELRDAIKQTLLNFGELKLKYTRGARCRKRMDEENYHRLSIFIASKKNVKYEDIVTIDCISDTRSIGCTNHHLR